MAVLDRELKNGAQLSEVIPSTIARAHLLATGIKLAAMELVSGNLTEKGDIVISPQSQAVFNEGFLKHAEPTTEAGREAVELVGSKLGELTLELEKGEQ